MTANFGTFQQKAVPEGATAILSGKVHDLNGADLPGAMVETLEVTILDEATKAVIGLWDERSIKNANGGTLASDGTFEVKLPAEEVVILQAGASTGWLKVLYKWTWGDGDVGRYPFSFAVANLENVP